MACFLLVAGLSKAGGPSLAQLNSAAGPAGSALAFTNAALPVEAGNQFNVEQNTVPTRRFERLLAFHVPTNAEDRRLLATNTSGR